jgi:hypothetical protein
MFQTRFYIKLKYLFCAQYICSKNVLVFEVIKQDIVNVSEAVRTFLNL